MPQEGKAPRGSIFLAHARADKKLAHAVATRLRRRNVRVFDADRQPSEEPLEDRIRVGVARADWFVLLVGAAKPPPSLSFELGYALATKTPAIALALSRQAVDSLPPHIKGSLTTFVFDSATPDEIAARILRILRLRSSARAKTFGRQMRELLLARGITLRSLATAAGLTTTRLGSVLRDEQRLTAHSLARVLTAIDELGDPLRSGEWRALLASLADERPRRSKRGVRQ